MAGFNDDTSVRKRKDENWLHHQSGLTKGVYLTYEGCWISSNQNVWMLFGAATQETQYQLSLRKPSRRTLVNLTDRKCFIFLTQRRGLDQ